MDYEDFEDESFSEKVQNFFKVNENGTGAKSLRRWALFYKLLALFFVILGIIFICVFYSESNSYYGRHDAYSYLILSISCAILFLNCTFIVAICHALATSSEAGKEYFERLWNSGNNN